MDQIMRTLVIKNSEWLRGETSLNSFLVRYDGKKCCIGIDAIARGISAEFLRKNMVKSPFVFNEINGTIYQNGQEVKEPIDVPVFCKLIDDYNTDIDDSEQPNTDTYVFEQPKIGGLLMEINDNSSTSDEFKIEAMRPLFSQLGIEIDWGPNE